MGLVAAVMMAAVSPAAIANTAGGTTIHNTAKLTFNGGGPLYASVDVLVTTVASAPTISVDSTTATLNSGDTQTITYTVTNTSNGSDDYSFNAAATDSGLASSPGIDVNGTGGSSTSLTLGGSVTNQNSDAAGNVYIPAGSENNLSVGDTLVIPGVGTYTIASLTAGTPATTSGGTTTAETPTSMTLTPVGGAPAIGAGTVAAGTQIGEQVQVTVDYTAPNTATSGVNGTSVLNISGQSTANDAAGNPVTYDTTGGSSEVTITVSTPTVTFTKEVRNVSTSGTFASTGVNAQTGDTLEYRITATPVSGTGNVNGAQLEDEVPAYTTYIAGSTTLNGAAVADGPGASLPLTNANGGMQISSPSGAAGVVVDGESAVVTFQVTVD